MNKLAPFLEMLSMYGVEEIKGSKHEPLILQMFKDAGFAGIEDDETAWCAAGANAALFRTGYKTTGKLTARSFMGDKTTELKTPYIGCIVVFWRGDKNGWQGHVAFWVNEDDKYIYCLGGNQSNSMRISKYPKTKLLGYREPIYNAPIEGVTEEREEFNGGEKMTAQQINAVAECQDLSKLIGETLATHFAIK